MATPGRKGIESRRELGEMPLAAVVFGCSEAMRGVERRVEKLAFANVPVLIRGENGTGKSLLARYIHTRSPGSQAPFVKVNCAAIPSNLLESELFGYEQGAFTDAQTSRPGLVEGAQGGTLFLDEIADLDISLQSKILHLLQDGRFSRLGGREELTADIRVICATSRNLDEEMEAGRFRHDLFYRINVISIHLPPLRERREDIVTLAKHFLENMNMRFERDTPLPPPEVLQALALREWRGNVRELENVMARYSILGTPDALQEPGHRYTSSAMSRSGIVGIVPLKRIAKQAIRQMEGSLILEALRQNKWNRRKAAQALNISYRALIYKIQEAGLSAKGNRKAGQPRPGGESDGNPD